MFRYKLIRTIMNIVRLLLGVRITVTGQENIPTQGPVIVVLNHTSVADTPLLLLAFPPWRWRFFAGIKWRSHPIYGPIMGWLGAIYIDQENADRRGLREAIQAIAAGGVFGLAPEAHRSRNGQLMPAMDGAAYLASRTGAPLLPVGLVNVDKLFANVRRLRPTEIEVRVGEPFTLPAIGRRARGADLAAYTDLIMAHIAALLPESYHGHYADSSVLAALQQREEAAKFIHPAGN